MYNKVMIIDDTFVDRYVAEKFILRAAFAKGIISVESAQEGLSYLSRTALNPDELPGIIFLDIKMPDIDGFGFLERFETLPEIVKSTCAVVMLSSSLDLEDIEKAEQNKYVLQFMNKPLDGEKLSTIKPDKAPAA